MYHSIAIDKKGLSHSSWMLPNDTIHAQSMEHTSYATLLGGVPRNILSFILECVYQGNDTRDACHITDIPCHRKCISQLTPSMQLTIERLDVIPSSIQYIWTGAK